MKLKEPNHLVLSRRNLLALLAKLDGYPPNSYCEIGGGEDAPGFRVTAEEDSVHYANRPPGAMHSDTEARVASTRPNVTL